MSKGNTKNCISSTTTGNGSCEIDIRPSLCYNTAMNIKILIAYHKQTDLVQNEVFLPIAVGEKTWAKNILRDDDGENISEKNPAFNELTAVYYAWKNYEKVGDPDYIGLNHYRRFFIFDERKYAYYETADFDDIFTKINYNIERLEVLLSQYDFFSPMPNKRKSVYHYFSAAHGKEDLENALRIIEEKYPEYFDAAKEYVSGKAAYFYNAFLFGKEEFFRYCDFLFGVLFDLEKESDNDRLFISEVLTGIYFTQLKKEGKKELRLPVLFVGKKVNFAASVAQTKQNFAAKNGSFVHRIKPLIVYFTPNFLLLSRKRKTVQ